MPDIESPWETEHDTWEPEIVSPRNKVLWFIVSRVKQGVSEEQLRKELAEFIKANHLDFSEGDINGMIRWAYRKFASDSNGEAQEN